MLALLQRLMLSFFLGFLTAILQMMMTMMINSSAALSLNSTLRYPVTLALLHHFSDDETLPFIPRDTLFSSPLSIELPPMKHFDYKVREKLATPRFLADQLDKIVSMSLKLA